MNKLRKIKRDYQLISQPDINKKLTIYFTDVSIFI